VATTIDAWKSYGGSINEEHERTTNLLTLEKKEKDEFTITNAHSKGQMEFCLEELSNAFYKVDTLEELK